VTHKTFSGNQTIFSAGEKVFFVSLPIFAAVPNSLFLTQKIFPACKKTFFAFDPIFFVSSKIFGSVGQLTDMDILGQIPDFKDLCVHGKDLFLDEKDLLQTAGDLLWTFAGIHTDFRTLFRGSKDFLIEVDDLFGPARDVIPCRPKFQCERKTL